MLQHGGRHRRQLEALRIGPDQLRVLLQVGRAQVSTPEVLFFHDPPVERGARLDSRDDEVFEDPFLFDVTRHPNRHLGFGTGEHFCLGAHVARMSSRALLQELGQRVESLEPDGEPTQIHASFVVGLKTLPVRYKIRPSQAA